MSPLMPRVSIVVPAYNAAKYIDEAVQSLLAQTYPNVEVILLDDGSTDNTLGLLTKYADRCVVDSHPNMGQAATLNSGWARASGQILGYLSADDRLTADAVMCAVKALNENPDLMAVYPDYELIDENSLFLRVVSVPECSYPAIVLRGECPIGPGAFFRRSVFERTGGWDATLRQIPDYDFWLRVGLVGTMTRIARVLAQFRVHVGSQTFGEPSIDKADEHRYVIEKYFARTDVPAEIAPRRRFALGSAYILSARLHLRAGRYLLAMSVWWKAARYSVPSVLQPRAIKLVINGIFGRQLHYAKRWLRGVLDRGS
jgi:GT2 family glycosyltransferase